MAKYLSQYSPVDTVDDDQKLSGDAERFGAEPRPKSRTHRLWLTHGMLICTSFLSFTSWMRTPSIHLRIDTPSLYSPANVAIEPVIVRFNGTLDYPSIYRGPPSPEIDAAWDKISHNTGTIQMTREEMLKAGTTVSELRSKVRYPDKYGGGYMATLEAAHQLHCLNLLRKATWSDYYESANDSSHSAEAAHQHLDHCIEMMRQNIMCNADVTMITWYWVQGHTVPYPNFNTRHRCRNFEKIRDWFVEHSIDIDESEISRSEDTVNYSLPFALHPDA